MRIRGQVFDGDEVVGPAEIVVEDGAIASVERVDSAPDVALLPGLIDTHVHLLSDASGTGDFYTWPLVTTREEQVLHGLAHLRRLLECGVTTVRDMAADTAQVALRRAVDAGVVQGASVVTHAVVGMTAGHHDLFTPAALTERPPVADGPDACRALVRRHARDGHDGIKIATTGGVLSLGDHANQRNYTDAELEAIVDEAHALGMRVAAHAHTAEGVLRALAAGVDSLEHATTLDAEGARRAVELDVTVAPTLLINSRIADGSLGFGPEARMKAGELVARRDVAQREAVAAGVRLVLGTDANGNHVRFGDQAAELRQMHAVLGIDRLDVLRGATSWAADAIARSDRGRLRVGARADIVVTYGLPWDDLAAVEPEQVLGVVQAGRLVGGSLDAARS